MSRKKPPASASAAQLLLSRGRRAAAADESIEFFSALRDCQTDHHPHVSVQDGRRPGDGPGNARSSSNAGELLSTEIGKNDYDWLLTPPATPLRSPAASGATGSAAALNRLARATSASHAKSNSPLSLTRRGNGTPTSRLARSSSATHSSINATAAAGSPRRLMRVRTMSSASSSPSSTTIIAASNASGSSTPLGSAATSPRTPAALARSTARSRRPWDVKAHARQVSAGSSQQRKAPPSGSSSPPPTSARPRAATTGSTSPRSTTVTSQLPDLARRGANAVARSRSTALGAPQAPPHGVRPSVKPGGPASAAVKQRHGSGMAAANTATPRWRLSSSSSPSPSPAVAALKSAPRGNLLEKRSTVNGDGRKINVERAAPHRTAGLAAAAVGSGLMRTGSRKSANTDGKRTGNEDDDGRRHGEALANRKPTVQRRSIRSTAPGGRLVFTAVSYQGGSVVADGRSTSKKGKLAAAAAAARLTEQDVFPSTRYDAMLLKEDPKNLTWLNGCGADSEHDESSGGAGLIERLLEPFDLPVAGV